MKRKNIKTYIIFTVFIISIIYLTYFSYSKYTKSTKQKVELQNTLTILQAKQVQDIQVLKEYNTYFPGISDIQNTIVTNNSLLNWVNQENLVASITGNANTIEFQNATVTQNNIQINGNTSTAPIQDLIVNINLQGNFQQLVNFLAMMENSYYFTNVTSIASQTENSGALNTSITLELHIS